jgi:FkbM family methyltransferase
MQIVMENVSKSIHRLINKYFLKVIYGLRLYRCNKIFLGSEYGGWTICPDLLSDFSIVYSIGIGEDASFDLEVMKRYGVELHAFDPTPKSIDWVKSQKWPPNFRFHPIGVGGSNRDAIFYPPTNPNWVSYSIIPQKLVSSAPIKVKLRRLATITNDLGHDKIDLLKMDIEGAEYEVIDDLLAHGFASYKQLLIEFHHSRPEISIRSTINAIIRLNKAGYKLFNISRKGYEFSFVR